MKIDLEEQGNLFSHFNQGTKILAKNFRRWIRKKFSRRIQGFAEKVRRDKLLRLLKIEAVTTLQIANSKVP